MFDVFLETIQGLLNRSGIVNMTWQQGVMILISGLLMYLAIKKGYEPLLLLPIAFGMLLTNLPVADIFHMEYFVAKEVNYGEILHNGGLLDFLYLGVKLGIYPSLIFLGIGCMTDFGPLIANPKSFLLGAAAQAGIFVTFIGALGISALIPESAPEWLQGLRFTNEQAASIAIIGGADGPTAILVAKTLAPALLGSIAVAAYSYMALVPIIQPPIMKALTTKKERSVVMKQLRPVSKTEKIIFPIVVTLVICLIVPDATPLIGMFMLGNLMKESGAVDRLVKTAQNELMNIVTIFLGISVGATTKAEYFLNVKILGIIVLGLFAFCIGTAAGVLFGKLMYVFSKGQVNPLIGSAGVSAVPMAARVSQRVGAEANPVNFLLMHAMGPNVAGVIGSAVAAGVLLSIFA
ncbi:sodium ion-translocating decarboxylase subunit beta [Paludicola sp. MB14-C6]|uniref:sodium ion-translocating decarboxylase subunit beta n=1 Tax=Paludihabitans sp. MB14-C6 TaxID=3070656 RepID=UPI0027DE26A9|nr:sodium ion-translocating decarboxylase subunit beta [Paludicola sp. MB14-C6]WMJ22256.1 sodium ion-translocating decarboxylase subunit beta [Paludicola sp. MB14-C6]